MKTKIILLSIVCLQACLLLYWSTLLAKYDHLTREAISRWAELREAFDFQQKLLAEDRNKLREYKMIEMDAALAGYSACKLGSNSTDFLHWAQDTFIGSNYVVYRHWTQMRPAQ